jgi:hypothetical protein
MVKCQAEQVEELKARYNGITDLYNMSHKYRISISFDSDVDGTLLKQLIKNSHDIVMNGKKRLKTPHELALFPLKNSIRNLELTLSTGDWATQLFMSRSEIVQAHKFEKSENPPKKPPLC